MHDYYEDLCHEWGNDLVDENWNYDTIYKALTIPKFERSDEIAKLMFSIGNDSTWNDVLIDLTQGNLTVDMVAKEIFRNIE